MKKGVTFGVFPKNLTTREVFAMAKAAGLDGVEVAFAETGDLRLDSTPAEIAAVKTAAREEGIELYSVFSGVLDTMGPTSLSARSRVTSRSPISRRAWSCFALFLPNIE